MLKRRPLWERGGRCVEKEVVVQEEIKKAFVQIYKN